MMNTIKTMTTSSHAASNNVFGNVDFVLVFFIIEGQKMRISASSQKSISKKSIFCHFEVIFLNISFSQDGGD